MRSGTFRSLRHRNFRLFFAGQFLSNVGTWAQLTVITWLIVERSDSGIVLGVFTACVFGPVLFIGPVAGLLADRHDKRRMLLITQSAGLVQAVALALVEGLAGPSPVGVLMGLGLVQGVVMAFDNPPRRSFQIELVSPEDIPNATALNSTIVTGSRVIGPGLGMLLLGSVGPAGCFVANAVSYLAVLVSLVAIRPREVRAAPRGDGSVLDGVREVVRDPVLSVAFVMMIMVGLFGFNSQVLLPLLTRRAYHAGVGAYTLLASVASAGALVGSLVVATRRVVILSDVSAWGLVFGASLIAQGLAPGLAAGVVATVILGGSGTAFVASANTLLSLRSPPELRGRVLSLTAIVFLGSTPIGGPLTGAVAEWLGVRWAAYLTGAILLVVAAWGRRRAAALAAPGGVIGGGVGV